MVWKVTSCPMLPCSPATSDAGIESSLDRALGASSGRLFALPTYTALLELRKLLADRGLAKEFWR